MRSDLPSDLLEDPDNVRLGEEGRFTRRGRDLQEDGPLDKDKRMTEAWTTWGLQNNATTPRSCTTSYGLRQTPDFFSLLKPGVFAVAARKLSRIV